MFFRTAVDPDSATAEESASELGALSTSTTLTTVSVAASFPTMETNGEVVLGPSNFDTTSGESDRSLLDDGRGLLPSFRNCAARKRDCKLPVNTIGDRLLSSVDVYSDVFVFGFTHKLPRADRTLRSSMRFTVITVGDRVLLPVDVYSDIFGFTHRLPKADSYREFARPFSDDAGQLVTASHYIYLNGDLQAAENAAVGELAFLGDGRALAITSVGREKAYGLYNPQTVHGDIVVSGFVTSTYTQAVDARVAHFGFSVDQVAFSWFGVFTAAFESGSELTTVLPRAASTWA